MTVKTILKQFIWRAELKRMDLSGNKSRFFNPKTARAWTAFLTKARGAA
jgi:hypothetical protein